MTVHLRQLGQYDASFEAHVGADGLWRVEGGSYVTRGVREGRLSRRKHAALIRLAEAVDLEAVYAVPAGARGFTSTLEVGGVRVEWWGPPPTAPLQSLAGALAALGA